MKKADGNLYFRRLFVYILIPFFAGPFSGGLPTPAITMRPPERRQSAAAGKEYGPPCCLPSGALPPCHAVPGTRRILLRLLSLALFYRFEALLYPAVYFRQVSFQGRQFGLLAPGTSTTSRRTNIFSSSSFFSGIFPVSARWSRARG